MIAGLAAVLAASLVGSLHCAGMCGGLVAFCGGTACGGRREHLGALATYHGGRLAVYATLGAIAGALGAGLDRIGAVWALQRPATIIAGLLMIGWGATLLLGRWRGRGGPPAGESRMLPLLERALRAARCRSATTRALVVGVATGLMPCGWLWAFVVAAAGTGAATRGALLMGAFWLGTVPLLTGLGLGAGWLRATLGPRLQTLTGVALLLLGLLALGGRLGAPLPDLRPSPPPSGAAAQPATTEPACH